MKLILNPIFIVSLFVPNSSIYTATNANQQTVDNCGTYRWYVKTLTDSDGENIFKSEATNSTIENLINEKRIAPYKERDNTLRYDDEKRKVKIEAIITQIKLEKDNDFHIVLKSGSNTMVGEVPDGDCGSFSTHPELKKYFNELRKKIVDAIGFTPTLSFKKVNKNVVIEGIPFWDEIETAHKPKGSCENQHELHPITNITFK
jgi:hypothetical protein